MRNTQCVLAIVLILITGISTKVIADEPTGGVSTASISPTRIVVPAGQKSGSITLTNNSNVEVAYRFSLIEMGLDKSGQFRQLETHEMHADQKSAKTIVRFSPRQVRLKPGASQTVRAIVRRSSLAVGEYRSHLKLQALPVLTGSGIRESQSGDIALVNSSAGLDVGLTIPVIVRHRETEANVTLKKLKLNRSTGSASASVLLGLQGNRTAFGDFSVSLVNGKKEQIIGKLRGFALFYPYPEEWVNIPLGYLDSVDQLKPNSRIRVTFKNRANDSDVEYWLDDVATAE